MIMQKGIFPLPIYGSLLISLGLSCLSQTPKNGPASSNNNESLSFQTTWQAAADSPIAQYVVDIFEDSRGQLWFGTMAKGVACFDGQQLRYFTPQEGLADQTVVSTEEDSLGYMWFGTHRGASRYDGEKFEYFGPKQGLTGAGCNLLVDRSGQIWAGTNDGLFRFEGSSFVKFELPNPFPQAPSYKWVAGKVWDLMEDQAGNLWIARDGYGVCKYDGKNFTHFTVEDGLCSNNVSQILEDAQGRFWFASLSSDFPEFKADGGLARLDGETMAQFSEVPGLHQNDVYTLYADPDGKVWIGATGLGAYRYEDPDFTLFSQSNRPDLTENFGIQSILADRQKNLWFGFSGGLFRFDGKQFVHCSSLALGAIPND